MSETVTLYGISGTPYRYWIASIRATTFKAKPGNYAFARLTQRNEYYIVYVGETADFSTRFYGHHVAPCLRANDATHILTHTNSEDRSVREREVLDLIPALSPPCNSHLDP